jgi:hypothetical protein
MNARLEHSSECRRAPTQPWRSATEAQFVVSADRPHDPVVEHHDPVRLGDRREPKLYRSKVIAARQTTCRSSLTMLPTTGYRRRNANETALSCFALFALCMVDDTPVGGVCGSWGFLTEAR